MSRVLRRGRKTMLEELERTLREAGDLALTESLNVTAKGRSDFVTSTDLAIDRYLCGALPGLVPGSRVFSEEEADGGDLSGRVFIVDPIDGTTNLMYHMQLSAISCGYAEDGRLLAAGVYNPFTQEMFLAQLGKGATLNGRPIHVNADETLEEAVLGVEAGPATIGEGQRAYFERVFALHIRGRGMRFTGSAALDLCYTACGRFTASVFHYLYPWDYAAGWLILAEAGGRLTLLDGRPPAMKGRSAPLAASNGLVHEKLLSAFA